MKFPNLFDKLSFQNETDSAELEGNLVASQDSGGAGHQNASLEFVSDSRNERPRPQLHIFCEITHSEQKTVMEILCPLSWSILGDVFREDSVFQCFLSTKHCIRVELFYNFQILKNPKQKSAFLEYFGNFVRKLENSIAMEC